MKKIKLFAGVSVFVLGSMLAVTPLFAENNQGNNQGGDNQKNVSGMMNMKDSHGNDQNDNPKIVGSTLEVHINDNGQTLVRGAKVTSVVGNTINATTAWGTLNINWVVNAPASVLRRFSGKGSISEISQGDYISFSGPMDVTSTTAFTVNANSLKDWSIQTKRDSFTGMVKSVNATASSLVLTSKESGDITVNTTSITMITKGSVAVPFSSIMVGDNVFAQGLYNNTSSTVAATTVKVLVNEKLDKAAQKHMFEGTVKSISGTTSPTTFVLMMEDNLSVTVNVAVNVAVVGNTYQALALSAIQAGDRMSVMGTLNTAGSVDAAMVRDLNR